jgi:hypothetical protein
VRRFSHGLPNQAHQIEHIQRLSQTAAVDDGHFTAELASDLKTGDKKQNGIRTELANELEALPIGIAGAGGMPIQPECIGQDVRRFDVFVSYE